MPFSGRVLFTISCFSSSSSGNGGHYYSLQDMAVKLGVPYQILVIGDFLPDAYSDRTDVLFIEAKFNGVRRLQFEAIEGLVPADIIHAYDLSSGCFSASLSRKWKVPLVFTKPGGPSYKWMTPLAKNMIVFHQKDYDSICARMFPPKNIRLIANRVDLDDVSGIPTADPFQDLHEEAVNIVTIGRIARTYENKIEQAVALRSELASRYAAANLCIIGKVEHQAVYERLLEKYGSNPSIKFMTSAQDTHKAARFLRYADVAVGTGRGLMEALGFGVFSFFPVKNVSLPCLAYQESYQTAFEDNFSPRVVEGGSINSVEGIEKFVELYDEDEQRAYKNWAQKVFKSNHDIRTGVSKTLEFYDSLSGHANWLEARLPQFRFWLNGLLKRLYRQSQVILSKSN